MSQLPNQLVNVTASGITIADLQASVYAHMLANSDWTMLDETEIDTASPGPGSYSWCAQSESGQREICVINDGTQATPSTTQARVGVNPDGSGDSCIDAPGDSRTPWAQALNFSGNSLANMRAAFEIDVAVNAEFTYYEWDECICVLFKNTARTYFPRGWMAGNVWVPNLTSHALVGDAKIDGNGVLGSSPLADIKANQTPTNTSGRDWLYGADHAPSRSCMRVGDGQTMQTATNNISKGWATMFVGSGVATPNPPEYAAYLGGHQPFLWGRQFKGLNYGTAYGYVLTRYVLGVKRAAPMSLVPINGKDVAMVIGNSLTTRPMALPAFNGWVPN